MSSHASDETPSWQPRPIGVTKEQAGSIAGFLATAPMTIVMAGLHRTLPPEQQEPLPPRQVAENLADSAGVDLGSSEETRQAATLAMHFGYGAGVGSMYGAMAGATGLSRPVEGMLYGLAVYAGSYLGLLPGAGLYRSATEEPPARRALMVAAHLVWGASLGFLMNVLSDEEQH